MFCYLKKSAAKQGALTWWAAFDAEGLGRHSLRLPGDAPESKARTAMAQLYRVLLAGSSQMALPVAVSGAPELLAEAIDLWQPTHEADTAGGNEYVTSYTRSVRKELGGVPIAIFAGRTGTLRLQGYRDELAAKGLSAKTRKNRLSLVGQVLRFCVSEGWLPGLPVMPRARMKGEKVAGPVYDYIDEATLRAIRAYIYSVETSWTATAANLFPASKYPKMTASDRAAAFQLYIQARRLYLSLGFYTGMRTKDLNETIGADFSPDFGRHRRRSSKTSKTSRDKWLESPEQLTADVQATRVAMAGKWSANASVTGGIWLNVAVVMNDAKIALGLSVAPTPRILRRSFVRQLALRGWDVNRVREHMGHSVESSMLLSVYQDCPEAPARCFKNVPMGGLDWTIESTKILEGDRQHEGGRIVNFPSATARGASLFSDE